MKRLFLLSITLFLVTTFSLRAQQQNMAPQHFHIDERSTIEIKGRTPINSFTMNVKHVDGFLHTPIPDPTANNYPQSMEIQVSMLQVPTRSIKGPNRIMSKKTHEALGAEQFPTINYEISWVDLTQADVNLQDSVVTNVLTHGSLAIKNVSKLVKVPLDIYGHKDYIRAKGQYTINMTEFNVDPPSTLFGAVKSDEEITITFDLYFAPAGCETLVDHRQHTE
jgi:hypothetical protein